MITVIFIKGNVAELTQDTSEALHTYNTVYDQAVCGKYAAVGS